MSSVNKCIIVGRIGKDPETRRMNDGSPVVNFSVATSESWRDKQSGERKEKAQWHSIVVFNEHICKVAEQYLRKGSKVYIEGALQTRKWQDQSGTDRYTTEIVLQKYRGELQMLGAKDGQQDNHETQQNKEPQTERATFASQGIGGDIDDDIPF